jgi:hypothetical protein
MFKEFLTKNLVLKATALAIAVVIWLVARHWLLR